MSAVRLTHALSAPDRALSRAQASLGTRVEIHLRGLERGELLAASTAAFAAIAEVHARMSFHAADSDLARVHASAGAPVAVHPWTWTVLETALELERASAGAFDVTVAPKLVRWGLLPRPRGAWPRPSAQGGARSALELLPGSCVRLVRPAWIDLGGIAKGFAVDRAIEVLRRAGVPAALVNAGGDLRAYGAAPWTVAIRDPRRPSRLAAEIALDDEALATSGPYFSQVRRRGRPVSALVDPLRRQAVRGARSASILAPTCMAADALAKVALVLPSAALAHVLDCYSARAIVLPVDPQPAHAKASERSRRTLGGGAP